GRAVPRGGAALGMAKERDGASRGHGRSLSKPIQFPPRENAKEEDMTRIAIAAALAAAALAAPARAADVAYHLIGAPNVVTLVNLHPDEPHKRLYSVNYQ